jgi:hypothetical protein
VTEEARSPLTGIGYDAVRGELDLHRFVPSSTDDRIRAFVAGYTPDMQPALREEDFYTLLAFARRTALAVMRGADDAHLEEARAAIRAVDTERVDWRDVAVATALVDDPDSSGYVRVEGPDGPGLVRSPLAPTVSGDLTAIAFRLQAVIEQDVYRVVDISGGRVLPAVWFSDNVENELAGLRATLTVAATLDPATSEEADSQQFSVFLAEAATDADAARLAAAAKPTDWFQALGLAAGPVCGVTIARSTVSGVAPFEQPGSLERFREPFAAVLGAPPEG